MKDKLQSGQLFVQANSTDSCPECTWFVRMFVDPAETDLSDATVTTSTMEGDKVIVEVRSAKQPAGQSGKGQLFMPVNVPRVGAGAAAQPEGTFLRLSGGDIDTKASNKAKIKKAKDDKGNVTHEISIG